MTKKNYNQIAKILNQQITGKNICETIDIPIEIQNTTIKIAKELSEYFKSIDLNFNEKLFQDKVTKNIASQGIEIIRWQNEKK